MMCHLTASELIKNDSLDNQYSQYRFTHISELIIRHWPINITSSSP